MFERSEFVKSPIYRACDAEFRQKVSLEQGKSSARDILDWLCLCNENSAPSPTLTKACDADFRQKVSLEQEKKLGTGHT